MAKVMYNFSSSDITSNLLFFSFIKKAYDPDGFGVIPYKALGTLFGVKRLDSTIYQLVGGKPKWQDEIDNKVFYD